MGCKLQDRQQRFLKKSFADGDWDESDVPVQDEGALTPMVIDAFVGLARDGSKALKEEFKTNDAQRIKMWLHRLSFGKDESASKDVASKKIEEPISKQCQEDLTAQGATKLSDLAFLELTLALARTVKTTTWSSRDGSTKAPSNFQWLVPRLRSGASRRSTIFLTRQRRPAICRPWRRTSERWSRSLARASTRLRRPHRPGSCFITRRPAGRSTISQHRHLST